MHNHDDKYPTRPGFKPGTSRLQAPVDTMSHRRRPMVVMVAVMVVVMVLVMVVVMVIVVLSVFRV